MKKLLLLLAVFTSVAAFGQYTTHHDLLVGLSAGYGKIEAHGYREQSISEYGLFIEKEVNRGISFKLMPQIGSGTLKKERIGYSSQSFYHSSVKVMVYDLCLAARFNIPIRRFRISTEMGPVFSSVQRKGGYFFIDPKEYSEAVYGGISRNQGMVGGYIAGSISYDVGENLRVWAGYGWNGRLDGLFGSSEFSDETLRIGCALRFPKYTHFTKDKWRISS